MHADQIPPETAGAREMMQQPSTLDDLHHSLQQALEQYLKLLDQYTICQELIQKHYAAGFFSLAQANTRSAIGRRYGQDWYDDRTKATACATYVDDTKDSGDQLLLVQTLQREHHVASAKLDSNGTKSNKANGLRAVLSTNEKHSDQDKTQIGLEHEEDKKLQKDPLYWYGLLPPQALRSAQASFRAILSEIAPSSEDANKRAAPVVGATNAARGMRLLEPQIRRLRKSIRQLERGRSEAASVAPAVIVT